MSTAMQDSGLLGTPEEFFRPETRKAWSRQWGIDPSSDYDVYIRHALDYSTGSNGVFSAKFHWEQMVWFLGVLRSRRPARSAHLSDSELLAHWLPTPRFVYLYRRDSARQAMSYFRAARSGRWLVRAGENTGQRVASTLERQELTDLELSYVRDFEKVLCSHNEEWLGFFESNGILPLDIAYEDFVADYAGTVGRIVEFVGCGAASDVGDLAPRLIQQSDEITELLLAQYRQRRDTVASVVMPHDQREALKEPRLRPGPGRLDRPDSRRAKQSVADALQRE